jgi:hypothetical protein
MALAGVSESESDASEEVHTRKRGAKKRKSGDDEDEESGAADIPLFARFLSYLTYKYTARGTESGEFPLFAQDIWTQLRVWARANNYKLKCNAAGFAADITRFAEFQDSGVQKQRNETGLIFTFDFHKVKRCLEQHALLDVDVW